MAPLSRKETGSRAQSGRIANVAAVVWDAGESSDDVTACASELECLFEQVLVARRQVDRGDEPERPLDRLVAVLAASTADRCLIVSSRGPREPVSLILALTAWPEHDAVVPRRTAGPEPLCGIYRRIVVHDAARAALAAGVTTLEGLLERLDTGYIEDDDLAAIDVAR